LIRGAIMKKWQVILMVMFFTALPLIIAAEDSITNIQPQPQWYMKFKYTVVMKEGQSFQLEYNLHGMKPIGVVFYDPYTIKRLTDEDVASYKLQTPELEHSFLKFLYKEIHYAVDLNKDGKPDVLHIVERMPERYVNDDFVKLFGTSGIIKEIRKALEAGQDLDEISFTKKEQVVVRVRVDCPPFDGSPDYDIWDIRHKVPDGEDSYGGDGTPDDIKAIVANEKKDPPGKSHPELGDGVRSTSI